MRKTLKSFYQHLILDRPAMTLVLTLLLIVSLGIFAKDFKLDASAEALVLENDQAMLYYRAVRARYAADDFLVITYTPQQDVFSEDTLKDLQTLQAQLEALPRVESVTSILNAPLIDSPRVSLSDIQQNIPNLMSPGTNRDMARSELTSGPLYKDLIASRDGRTTVIQIFFKRDPVHQDLLQRRNALRVLSAERPLTSQEQQQHDELDRQFRLANDALLIKEKEDLKQIRQIIQPYYQKADIHLGGITMLTSDLTDFISHDLQVFGIGVLCFLVLLLSVFFRKPRWVGLPMVICFAAGIGVLGFLGLMEWRVTVVSSNFISLMLIITLSLCVHLIVRYREIHSDSPELSQRELVWQTTRSKAQPAFYTAITTMVAFGSLLVSGIRPVIDFGWMMVFGVGLAFVLTFLIFPAAMQFIPRGQATSPRDLTARITAFFAHLIEHHSNSMLLVYVFITVFSIAGLTALNVDNRFIDYFKKDTEIYQGMLKIDRELGGTTPLDVIIDPDKDFFEELEYLRSEGLLDESSSGISGTSYWFNMFQLETVEKVHDYLDSLPETGKVLSIATTMKLLRQLNNDQDLDNLSLSVMYKRLPAEIRETLFDPYMAADGNQIRFDIRILDSNKELNRLDLLNKIRSDLKQQFGFSDDQIKLSGMTLLYNNMLQSLYRSQILTLGVVFVAILFMFIILFRSISISILAIIPNVIAAIFVLGLMGWLHIPLDVMTITIAAITIGIGVDDTIHYVHRFMEEYPKDRNYWATVKRCHNSIGKAMYYTTVTITLGFSILVLSSFVPTIYFGILTGIAMVVALLANFTLLPLLLVKFKPMGKENKVEA